jgi:ABC-type amino acid transport substrate-binding protein
MVRWLTLLLTTAILVSPAIAADLEGTLKKIKSANSIAIGYRDSSRPFSFTGDDGKPAGYSVDICNRIVTSIAKELSIPNLQAKWVKVTVADRMQLLNNGTIDLECGSTTASLARQEQVDFSLLTFVDGGSLLVTDASGIRGVSTIGGKRVAIIPGTTTEKGLNDALKKHSVTVTIVPVKDHAEGVAELVTIPAQRMLQEVYDLLQPQLEKNGIENTLHNYKTDGITEPVVIYIINTK